MDEKLKTENVRGSQMVAAKRLPSDEIVESWAEDELV